MKIVITTRYFYPHIGGGAIVLRHIFTTLVKKGYTVSVITSRLENTHEYEDLDGLKIFRPFRDTFFGIRLIPYLAKFLKLYSADIIFNCDYSCTLATSYAASKEQLPVITRVGYLFGRTAFQIMSPLRALFFWLIPGIAIRFGKHDVICCPSEEVSTRLKQFTKAEVIVIPNPIDINEITSVGENDLTKNIRSSFGANKNGQLLLFVGRLSREKDLDGLLKTLHNLEARFRLILVGSGPEKSKLTNLARKLGLMESVLFLGPKSHQETLAIMKSCDILILPSKTEVFPSVVIEALALGKPVIATRVGGVTEIKSANLHLIDNVGEITKVLPRIESKQDNGVLEYYSLDKICAKYIAMFNKFI